MIRKDDICFFVLAFLSLSVTPTFGLEQNGNKLSRDTQIEDRLTAVHSDDGCHNVVEPSYKTGSGDDLPKHYFLRPFPTTAPNASEKPVLHNPELRILEDGSTHLWLHKHPSAKYQIELAELDPTAVMRIFGIPDKNGVFHLIGRNQYEPNIFHIDIDYVGDKLTKYRVRGFGISHPEWNPVKKSNKNYIYRRKPAPEV